MKNFFPDIYVKSISCITASMLLEKGMEAVVLDIDNTLVPHDDPNPTERVKLFLEDMRQNGIKLCVVSNNSEKRVAPFYERIGIEYHVSKALKPRVLGYEKAAECMSVQKSKIAAIGDQIFTDVWGANRAGCLSVLVEPITPEGEGKFIKFKRILEKPFLRRIRGSAD